MQQQYLTSPVTLAGSSRCRQKGNPMLTISNDKKCCKRLKISNCCDLGIWKWSDDEFCCTTIAAQLPLKRGHMALRWFTLYSDEIFKNFQTSPTTEHSAASSSRRWLLSQVVELVVKFILPFYLRFFSCSPPFTLARGLQNPAECSTVCLRVRCGSRKLRDS